MIVVVAGVSGSGKSTVGALLATRLGWPFTDGDALHPAANVAKMRAGHPLTDADRQPWLAAVAARIDAYQTEGQSAVLACSALKHSYRDELTAGHPAVRIVFLEASRDVLAARLRARHGHFFPAALLDSQLADAQVPQPPEQALVIAATASPRDAVRGIMEHLHLQPAEAG
ncbi:MAG: gluconokinase [Streptosporangiales bacterium]